MKKKIISTILCISLLSGTVPIFASNSSDYNITVFDSDMTIIGNEKDVKEVCLESGKKVATSDLLHFDSVEEMRAYASTIINRDSSKVLNPQIMATDKVALVDRLHYSAYSIGLYVSYGTSKNGNRGHITYQYPFTQLSGVTIGVEWQENNIFSQIRGGKDIYAQANGTLNITSVVGGNITLEKIPVHLSGSIMAVR
jgi:hypothetical protein